MKKRTKKILLICILVVVLLSLTILYIGESIYVNNTVHAIVLESYNTYGENNIYSDIVTDEIFARMCYRNGYPVSSKGRTDVKEINSLSFPSTIHWIFGGTATYWYCYEIYDENGELSGGSWEIPVTITFEIQQGKLKIVDYFEAP